MAASTCSSTSMRGCRFGVQEIVGPYLVAAPGAMCGEVEMYGARAPCDWEHFEKAIAELGHAGSECEEAAEQDHAAEVEVVTVPVHRAFEGGGVLAAERQVDGREEEAGDRGRE